MEIIETNKAGTLSAAVTTLINTHIEAMGKNQVKNLYALVMEAIEPALFKEVLKFSHYNQSEAARCLGLSRGTLRTRLEAYFGEKYISKLKG
ncbi:helix-turn-helix domain-containing protein [Legionella feeleii]|uniref:Fis transcriptional activator n=1 Tax=Legionella feeleii TaxID=453 RepID=A0A0W0TXP7_9GAMM|nr:helix-turn-helix domain-containing protein [Legionella feeleii]KTD00183.1 Fis transcriptional activator [Legionella feeleii]SPX60144.1 Fis transcriptional activator [Legionella feeleii]